MEMFASGPLWFSNILMWFIYDIFFCLHSPRDGCCVGLWWTDAERRLSRHVCVFMHLVAETHTQRGESTERALTSPAGLMFYQLCGHP